MIFLTNFILIFPTTVLLPSKERITFLDTPGHAAFTSMRARGAQVTDIVILVVAADDGIMPQTIEALHHAQAANVPLIVAVNKCDKPTANAQRILSQLMEHDVQVESFGGEIPSVAVSALKGHGLLELEETILALAEVLDLRGDPHATKAEATVIESRVQQGCGVVASLLVQRGILRVGDYMVFGKGRAYCRIRKIVDENGRAMKDAGPSVPCEVIGSFTGTPEAGDDGLLVMNEMEAKQCVKWYQDRKDRLLQDHAAHQTEQLRLEEMNSLDRKRYDLERKVKALPYLRRKGNRLSVSRLRHEIDQLQKEIVELEQGGASDASALAKRTTPTDSMKKSSMTHEVLLVVKADVHGSVEAVVDSLMAMNKLARKSQSQAELITQEQVRVKVIHSGLGPLGTSDVELLAAAQRTKAASSAQINRKHFLVGFNIPQPSKSVSDLLVRYRIPLITQNVIYKLLDEVKGQLVGMLKPDFTYEVVGEAFVQALFEINKGKEVVAGCNVKEGVLYRTTVNDQGNSSTPSIRCRVLRDGIKVYEGPMKSLKHHKNDVQSISKGMDCGVLFGDNFKEVQVGDLIQSVKEVVLPPILE